MLTEISSIKRRLTELEAGAPLAVYVNGELVGVRDIVDFRADGMGTVIIGELLEDRVVIRVESGSYAISAAPAAIMVSGSEAVIIV